jgi:serine O-acetyltransferase
MEIFELLSDEIFKSFCWLCEGQKDCLNEDNCKIKAKQITLDLLENIPGLRQDLKLDIRAIFLGDPAAVNEAEIILSYPGFLAITVYRIAHYLYAKEVPLIPRLMTEIAHSQTGIDIHPGAVIGQSFCIDHGTGIVIGETAELGNNVKLYQGVTLGALSVPDRDNSKGKRHPTLKDNIVVYAKTTILGGDTIIGENSVIGGNTWITSSVPANSKIYFVGEKQVHKIK